MYDLTAFTLRDMLRCGVAIRELAAGASSMQDAAERIVHHLHEELAGAALVRCYRNGELLAAAGDATAGTTLELGGALPSGDAIAIVLHSTVQVSADTADLFRIHPR